MKPSALDHTQDLTGQETYRLTSLFPPPDFVKEASPERLLGDPETLPAHVYGDQSRRLYPCHSKAATWMSALFFLNNQERLEPHVRDTVDARIKQAAKFFNIEQDLQQLQAQIEKRAHYDLDALPDEVFALVWRDENGAVTRRYPLRNPAEIKMAEHWFNRYRDEFTFEDRQKMAQRIYDRARDKSVPLEHAEMITKTAGYGYAPTVAIVEMLTARAAMTSRSHPALSTELRKLAESLRDHTLGLSDSGTRDKIAAIVDQFDRETHLNKMYDEGGLERPEEVIYQITEKVASDTVKSYVQMPSGTIYDKSAFSEVPLNHIRDWLGEDFAEAVSAGGLYTDPEKIAAIAPTLPRSDAEMFDRMAYAAGVPVFARGKAASEDGLTMPDLVDWAAQYQTPGV